jgi:hypothetical protein
MKTFHKLIFLFIISLSTSCLKNNINIKAGISGGLVSNEPISPPSAPASTAISLIPDSTTESATFTLVEDPTATLTEIKILKKSDDSLVSDWTPITSGGNLNGLNLDLTETYYAVFRSVNSAGPSPEVVSPDWTPQRTTCSGDLLTNSPYAGGAGTIASPYLICTAAQLFQIASRPANFKSNFKLLADVDLMSAAFTPIGNAANFFKGHFDGNGKKIKNLIVTPATNNLGFFGQAKNAFIHDLILEDVIISAPTRNQVGALVGECTTCNIQNIVLNNINVTAAINTGGLVGIGSGTVIGVTASGSVTGTGFTGGLFGTSYAVVMDVTSTVSVSGSWKVGGLTGMHVGYLQKISVNSNINGPSQTGGLVGIFNGTLYRAEYTGTITGGDIAGIVATTTNGFEIASVSSHFNLLSTGSAAGAVNYIDPSIGAESQLKNILLSGTINLSSSTGYAGGFFPYVDGPISTEYSLSNVTITGDAEYVGGFAAVATAAQRSNYNAFIGDVTGTSTTNTISRAIGFRDPAHDASTSYVWSNGNCTNNSSGGCNSEGQPIPLLATFYDKTSTPFTGWDFSTIWKENALALPSLKQTQLVQTSYTKTCDPHAFAGVPYKCSLVVDSTLDDKFEFRTVSYDKSATCTQWLYASLTDHVGIPSSTDASSCVNAFRVTDGVNTNPLDTMQIAVHNELSIAPVTTDVLGFYIDFQGVSLGPSPTRTFVITNTRSYPISLSIVDPLNPDFSRAGGSCGGSLPAGDSCTLGVVFDPSTAGTISDNFLISYTGDNATALTLPFKVFGIAEL